MERESTIYSGTFIKIKIYKAENINFDHELNNTKNINKVSAKEEKQLAEVIDKKDNAKFVKPVEDDVKHVYVYKIEDIIP